MSEQPMVDRLDELERVVQTLSQGVIQAQRFSLMDDQGRERAVLKLEGGDPELHLLDEDGRSRLKLALTKDGPGITLADEREQTRAWLGFAQEALRIGFADEAGHSRAFFGVMPESGPVARFYDEGQQLVWSAPPGSGATR